MDAKALKEITSDISLLYVEDDEDLRLQTSKLFGHLFKEVEVAANGKIGLEKIQNKDFDLVITDINMPVMNGIKLCKNIHEYDKNIPIIITSAHDESTHLLELIDIGIDKFILKPLDMQKMIKTLSIVCININNKKLVKKYKLEKEESCGKVKEINAQLEILVQQIYDRVNKLDISTNDTKRINRDLDNLRNKLHIR